MFRSVAEVLAPVSALVATTLTEPPPPSPGVEWFEAGHPAPNAGSLAAGEKALALASESASAGGLLLLLSGGASAMLTAPAAGITLAEKTETAARLMEAGAPIHELNCVRKHLSRIKGGRLARLARRTVTLALSDVHGPVPDDPSVIGSGPTVPDDTTFADALQVVRSRRVTPPASVIHYLERGARGHADETLKQEDPGLSESVYVVVGNRHSALRGARQAAEGRGYAVVEVDAATTGEARDAAVEFVEGAKRMAAGVHVPLCVLASGETTVTVRGNGRGGRNQEFALAAVPGVASMALMLERGACLASAGTDGIDGPTDAAGALLDSLTLQRAGARGLDPDAFLARNDAYDFFDALGDLIRWGPTGTNVGDLHVLLVR